MTFTEAIAQQPQWVQYWLNWLFFGAFILPVVLFFWRQSRVSAVAVLLSDAANAVAVGWMFNELGYVRLLGLPHIFFWTPVVIFLFLQMRRPDMPVWPRRIILIVMVTIAISLAFDYVDVARYLLGERAPLASTG